MSFVPFFSEALKAGESFDGEKFAEQLHAGKVLATAIENGFLRSGFEEIPDAIRVGLKWSYLDAAVDQPNRTLYHVARYLAANGEYQGAGKLLEAYKRSDARLTLARIAKRATNDTMRATKALKTARWKAAVRAAAERIRSKERG